jgi:acyl-CoA thioester hydrolase
VIEVHCDKPGSMEHCHEALIGFPVVVTVPLLWGDHDAFGHVNNLACLRWCETARVEYLMRIGLWPSLPPTGVGPILGSVSCAYKRPLTFPDTAYIGARVTRIGNRSFQMQHRVVSKALDAVAAEVDSTIVVLDYSLNQTVPVPESCRRAIEDLESKPACAAGIDPDGALRRA